MHPHAVFNDLFTDIVILKPEETKEVSIFLFHNEAVKHRSMSAVTAISSLLKRSKTPKRLLFKSGRPVFAHWSQRQLGSDRASAGGTPQK